MYTKTVRSRGFGLIITPLDSQDERMNSPLAAKGKLGFEIPSELNNVALQVVP